MELQYTFKGDDELEPGSSWPQPGGWRFANSLVGFFVGKSVAFPLVKNYVTNTWSKFDFQKIMRADDVLVLSKDEVSKEPVWVKIHKVPVVVYSEDGLSLIASQIGKPIMLDAFKSAMFIEQWRRIGFARAPIEVLADKDLKKEVTMVVLFLNVKPVNEKIKDQNDGFTTVRNKNKKGKKTMAEQPRHIESSKLNKPKPKYAWSVKSNQNVTNKNDAKQQTFINDDINMVKLKNSFTALQNKDDMFIVRDVGESSSGKKDESELGNSYNDDQYSDSEVEELGLNRTPKQSKVRQIVNENHLSVYAILESHVDISTLSKNKNMVDVLVVAQSNQAIHAKIIHRADNKVIFCTFVYAGNNPIERRHLWVDLGLHKHVVRRAPWILMGDFNVSLNMEGSFLGSSSIDSAMCDFKDCVTNIEVFDINIWSPFYMESKAERKRISNHSPSMLKIPSLLVSKPKPFKFFNFLAYKLEKLFRKLMHGQGNLHERVNRLRDELDEVQKSLDINLSNSELRDEEAVYVQDFNDAKIDEERFLRQKAKIAWLEVRDLNLAYFYKTIKSRNQRSRIYVITTSNNVAVTRNQIPNVFVSHYKTFLGTNVTCNELDSEDLFQKEVSDLSNENMTKAVTNDEIKRAMFGIGDDKARGPNGFTSAFFKKGWDVVGQDTCNAVRDFFVNGKLLKEVNHTFLALISKVTTPLKVNDYRPISCCNVIYKCISKILTNRIIEGIKEVVSDNQSTFVPGGRISDNILITQELMHNYHRDRGPPRCAFKVNIQKAYDTVDWCFLDCILMCFGFHLSMIKWIKACVTSTSLSISINEEFDCRILLDIIKGKWHKEVPNLRVIFNQVHRPLPPPPIIVATIKPPHHHHYKELNIINVYFVDGLFLFARGDVDSAKVIMNSLDEFKTVSGLVPSIPKSTAYFCNVLNHVTISILNIMPFFEGELPGDFNYAHRLFLPCKCIGLRFLFFPKMESVGVGATTLYSCLKATNIHNIDGKVIGKDGSFASVVQQKPVKQVVKVKELRNSKIVDGAAIAIPLEAVEEVSPRFAKTLYGYFISKRLDFPLVENYVKLHHVPIVAYSAVGLSLITTQIGRPIMMDSYTSNMCLSSWGKSTYAQVLIEVVIMIPLSNGTGHTFATIDIEYELHPSRCSTCEIFDHVKEQCPKNPKVEVAAKGNDDGFTEVKKRKNKVTKQSVINESDSEEIDDELIMEGTNANTTTTSVTRASRGVFFMTRIDTSLKNDNFTTSISFSVLNVKEEEDEEVVNVYDESTNLVPNTNTSGSSSFMAVVDTYSASMVEMAKAVCFLVNHEVRKHPINVHTPLVLLRSTCMIGVSVHYGEMIWDLLKNRFYERHKTKEVALVLDL
uniref:Reverse transcriptase domain-containing protein n=1 Tax=Tanacetum cinerariifolium TaxID=118510 RepID=A0A6L2JTN6_TANCI|nr:hypothetical protein [Tanacetum cinerariifolium]